MCGEHGGGEEVLDMNGFGGGDAVVEHVLLVVLSCRKCAGKKIMDGGWRTGQDRHVAVQSVQVSPSWIGRVVRPVSVRKKLDGADVRTQRAKMSIFYLVKALGVRGHAPVRCRSHLHSNSAGEVRHTDRLRGM